MIAPGAAACSPNSFANHISQKQSKSSETLTDNPLSPDELKQTLALYGQQHVLQHWSQLTCEQQANLTAQLSGVDLAELANLVSGQNEETDFGALASRAVPHQLCGLMAVVLPGRLLRRESVVRKH